MPIPARVDAFGQDIRVLQLIESACIFRLTKLPLLTYPLIIEELRPEDTLAGASHFQHRGSRS